mgnify:CR=1 FL=1
MFASQFEGHPPPKKFKYPPQKIYVPNILKTCFYRKNHVQGSGVPLPHPQKIEKFSKKLFFLKTLKTCLLHNFRVFLVEKRQVFRKKMFDRKKCQNVFWSRLDVHGRGGGEFRVGGRAIIINMSQVLRNLVNLLVIIYYI